MDKGEVKKLFALLGELFPRKRQDITEDRLYAWALALEPYTYDEIRAAALEHARKNQFYPTVAEITANLPPPDKNAWMDEYISDKPCAGLEWQRSIDGGRSFDAADELGAVSRYARKRGIDWRAAKKELQEGV